MVAARVPVWPSEPFSQTQVVTVWHGVRKTWVSNPMKQPQKCDFSLFQVRYTVPLPDVLFKNNTQLFAWRQDKGSHLGLSQVCVLYDNMELKACLWATQAAA